MLKLFKNRSLRRRLSTLLTDAILHGELRPGERIVEGKLARELRVAQGTLREALQELEHQGLVNKHDRRGTFVCQLSPEDIEDIYVVRGALEPLAAMKACKRMTPQDHKQLADIIEKMRLIGETRNFPELLKWDLAFHRLIWRLSGSKSLERSLNSVCPPLFAAYLIKSSSVEPYNSASDLDEHLALLKAFETGNPQEVKDVFEETLQAFCLQDVKNLRAIEAARDNPAAARRADVLTAE